MRNPVDLKKGRKNAIYFASNADRLTGDHNAWSDSNLVGVLSAYVFDNRLMQV